MEWLCEPQIWTSLLTLTALEIVLGIDNLIFLSILAARLPPRQQPVARKAGLFPHSPCGSLCLRRSPG
jgi:predicted tellurium resistance membrane protein TerC